MGSGDNADSSTFANMLAGEFQYACFLHPERVGNTLDDVCPDCGRPFGFPLLPLHRPSKINDRIVTMALGRGFYGAVYSSEHQRLSRRFAVKVIPKATYTTAYSKSIEPEVRNYETLSESDYVAHLRDFGEEAITFGDVSIDCHWLELDFVPGISLQSKLTEGFDSPREIGQIAWDLLDFLRELDALGVHHNDLHGNNIVVQTLEERNARGRTSIHPLRRIKVLDLGTGGSTNKSRGERRLSDLHWVAHHLLAMLETFETQSAGTISQDDHRVCVRLRQVADQYLGQTDSRRGPAPADAQELIQSAYRLGSRPWVEPIHLSTISAYYNAKTMPAWWAPDLLHDPDGSWAARLAAPGPTMLHGMRGCGKTMLLRSLEWVARMRPRSTGAGAAEAPEGVTERLAAEGFVGLFVSCTALLHGVKAELVEAPVTQTYLAFAREAIQNLSLSEEGSVGAINYDAVRELVRLVRAVAPWFEPPASVIDLVGLEGALTAAMRVRAPLVAGGAEQDPFGSFAELARTIKRALDLWSSKRVLFMLDDVSTRVLRDQSVRELFGKLGLANEDFAFKISTESQSLQFYSPGGERARTSRDYDEFDLGSEVYRRLGGRGGAHFVSEVISRRARISRGVPDLDPSEVLGRRTLKEIAQDVQSNVDIVYWGLESLAATCVGDIGDALQLYQRMLDDNHSGEFPIKPSVQHDASISVATTKARGLMVEDANRWLLRHAAAFAEASRRELLRNKGRLRQYGEIHLRVPAFQQDDTYAMILRLIENGVFVLIGGNERAKSLGGERELQLKLAYRKLFGLGTRIPLGRRDRFEPRSFPELRQWLEDPKAEYLTPLVAAEPSEADAWEAEDGLQAATATPTQLILSTPVDAGLASLPEVRNLLTVKTDFQGRLEDGAIDWSESYLVGGLGYEDRCRQSWQRVLSTGRPMRAICVGYAEPGHRAEILGLLRELEVGTAVVETSRDEETAAAEQIIAGIPASAHLVIDVTGLTKVFIYKLCKLGIRRGGRLSIVYTEAQAYDSGDSSELILGGKATTLPTAALDRLAEDEAGQYETLVVDENQKDPGQATFLATFVPLRHLRVVRILDRVSVERVLAIVPGSSADSSQRFHSVDTEAVADYYVDNYGGNKLVLNALDHQAAFDALLTAYMQYAVGQGLNFELTLTGTKMYTVAAAMLGACVPVSSVYYSKRAGAQTMDLTHGSGPTHVVQVSLVKTEIRTA